jgi:hypothetical protein
LAQLLALFVVLKLPLAQAWQVRSVVVSPSAETYVPATQSVLALQAVAEFASLSHVPAAQAAFAVAPPGQ